MIAKDGIEDSLEHSLLPLLILVIITQGFELVNVEDHLMKSIVMVGLDIVQVLVFAWRRESLVIRCQERQSEQAVTFSVNERAIIK